MIYVNAILPKWSFTDLNQKNNYFIASSTIEYIQEENIIVVDGMESTCDN